MATHKLNKARTSTWEIDQPNDTWILGDKGSITLTGANMDGIFAGNGITAAKVRVDGNIDVSGQDSSGVHLESTKATINVAATAHISAAAGALYYFNGAGTVTIANEGLLEGAWGIGAFAANGGAEISNAGRILASIDHGIGVASAAAVITNSGIIKAIKGIYVTDGLNDPLFDPLVAANATHITNSGKITGSTYSIQADAVAANIRNSGTLNGDVVLGAGEDNFNNAGGRLNGDLFMGAGNDVVNMAGGAIDGVIHGGLGDDIVTIGSIGQVYIEEFDEGIDTLRINASYSLGEDVENLTLLGKASHVGIGNTLENVLIGNKGANALYGLYGNDRLDGGRGNDRLTGGIGIDTFVFKTGSGQDIVTDFEDGMDQVDLTGSGITTLNLLQTLMSLSADGHDVVITLNDSDRLVIRDMQMVDLGQFDFIFA